MKEWTIVLILTDKVLERDPETCPPCNMYVFLINIQMAMGIRPLALTTTAAPRAQTLLQHQIMRIES